MSIFDKLAAKFVVIAEQAEQLIDFGMSQLGCGTKVESRVFSISSPLSIASTPL